MKFIDVALSTWSPSVNGYLYRPGPRHRLDRDVNYEERFDHTTIIYDAFWSEDGSEILMICPPPEDLKGGAFAGSIYEVPSGNKCEIEVVNTGPVYIMHVRVSENTRSLRIEFPLGTYFVSPQPNHCAELAGGRYLIAHNKNNALHWIRDWVHFHVEMHGCTGVLFYDNGSSKYGKYDIRAALETVPRLEHAVLVDAPFPFGAINGPFGINDSRYFQRAYLEHAKYRLYSQAASIVHVDIDELVVSEAEESIFVAVENSRTGCASFDGVWIERVTDDGIEPPVEGLTHSLFHYVAAGGGRKSLRKTAIAPSRLGHGPFLTTHRVYGVKPDYEVGDRFKHRHFMGLKTLDTNIKNKARLEAEPFEKFDPLKHEDETVLAAQLKKVFESETFKAMPKIAPYAATVDGETCRRFAGVRFAHGDYAAAIEWTKKAIELAPDFPSYHQFLARCYEAVGRGEEAAAAAKQAQELWGTSPEYRVMQIKKLRAAREFDAAERAVNQLVSEFPDFAEAQIQYGEVLNRLGKRDEAEVAFRRAAELDPDDARKIWRWGSHLQRCWRNAEAVEVYRRILAMKRVGFGDRVRNYLSLASALEEENRIEEAAEVIRQAIGDLGTHHKLTTDTRNEFHKAADRLAQRLASPEGVGPPIDRAEKRRARVAARPN
jgi:tetratricopeptide (TPR) repeat protein